MPNESGYDALIALPCFRESGRLPPFLEALCRELERASARVCIQVVDDGSGPEDQRKLCSLTKSLRPQFPALREPLLLKSNQGKGAAIRAAWDSAPSAIPWLAFADADGAASAQTTARFLEDIAGSEPCLAIATRRGAPPGWVQRRPARALAARLLNKLIRWRYALDCSDTQCGLKAIASRPYHSIKAGLEQDRFGFDLEVILAARAQGIPLRQIPIRWTEVPGSRVTAGPALALVRDIWNRRI